ncbi:MAG: HEPN domain-containing protein [Bacteroidota bacterium]
MKDYTAYRLQKSKESLEAAKLLVQHRQWDASVNCLYYACFYIVSALFYVKNIPAKSHNGIRTQFNIHFILTGNLPREYGELYASLLDLRNKGDYSDFFDLDEDTVRPMIPMVEEFIEAIEKLL